jgi:hypothetical protein
MIMDYLLLLVGVALSAVLFNIAYRLFRIDKIEGEKNSARVRSIKDAFLGRAHSRVDWLPDARVRGGLIFNRKKNRIEISGRLSESSVDRAFR